MEYMQVNRANGRAANELRPVKLTRGVMKHAHARAWLSSATRACCVPPQLRRACRAGARAPRPVG